MTAGVIDEVKTFLLFFFAGGVLGSLHFITLYMKEKRVATVVVEFAVTVVSTLAFLALSLFCVGELKFYSFLAFFGGECLTLSLAIKSKVKNELKDFD